MPQRAPIEGARPKWYLSISHIRADPCLNKFIWTFFDSLRKKLSVMNRSFRKITPKAV